MARSVRLDVRAMGIAAGSLGALWMLLLWAGWRINWGTDLALLAKGIYPGFSLSPAGLVVGVVWGFVDLGIAGLLLAWVYNRLVEA